MSTATKIAFRKTFESIPKEKINWFPGHMRKAWRKIQDEVKKIDTFIEVRDARIPFTSHNSALLELIPPRVDRIVIFNKIDLANWARTQEYITYMKETEGVLSFGLSAKKHYQIEALVNYIQTQLNPKFKTIGNWMMIGGIPNVGKSTIINSLRKKESDINHSRKSGAKVGAIPCITRSMNGFKIMNSPVTYLIDTPGIIQPKILNNEDGLWLCCCGTIRDGIFDLETVSDYLLYKLNQGRTLDYVKRYNMRRPTNDIVELLKAVEWRYRTQNSHNIAVKFLTDFREGELGWITLDGTPAKEMKRMVRYQRNLEKQNA